MFATESKSIFVNISYTSSHVSPAQHVPGWSSVCMCLCMKNLTWFTWESLNEIYHLPFSVSGSIYSCALGILCFSSVLLQTNCYVACRLQTVSRHLQFMNMFFWIQFHNIYTTQNERETEREAHSHTHIHTNTHFSLA